MALEHALLVALSEQPASGLDLAKRFGRSIGFFWHATHQQIYRVLARMDVRRMGDGHRESPRPASRTRRCTPCRRPGPGCSPTGSEPTPMEPLRSELAVKMRGAAFGDRDAVLDVVRTNLAEHRLRLDHYRTARAATAGRVRCRRRSPRPTDRPRARPVPRPPRRDPHRAVLGRVAHRVPGGTRMSTSCTRPRRRRTPTCWPRSPWGASSCATAW